MRSFWQPYLISIYFLIKQRNPSETIVWFSAQPCIATTDQINSFNEVQ